MRPFVVLGLCLVAAALFVLARGGSFSARKDVIHVGDVTVSADVVALVGGGGNGSDRRSAARGMRVVAPLVSVAVLAAATASAQTARSDSTVYLFLAESRFDVTTGKSGLFGFAGHAHLIRARHPRGRVVMRPSAVTTSTVVITVPVSDLEVITPPDTAEIRKVTAAMRADVLRAELFPEITFVSTTVIPIDGGFRVRGVLTLVGASREVSIDLKGLVESAMLRMEGRLSIKQSDFGIKPYRGGPGGLVRVADRVELRFVVAAAPARG